MSDEQKHRNFLFNYLKIIITVFSTALFITFAIGEEYKITLLVKNQPQNQITIGTLKGDKFSPVDTLKVQPVTSGSFAKSDIYSNSHTFKTATFTFPVDCKPGIYRLILGQTNYAKVMNEPPQQIDFIFNNENIGFATDFKAPDDSLKIAESEENRVWFGFLAMEKEYREQLKEVEAELDFLGAGVSNSRNAVENRITQYNQLQKERDKFILHTVEKSPELFAAKLIKMNREPFLDGKLPKEERTGIFKAEYFENLDFTDEALINSSVYTEKVFKYLMSCTQRGLTREQQEQEFMKAIDVILTNTHENQKVYELILDYLVRGFEKLNLDKLITYIADKYPGTTCQTDERTTLERKLETQKMKNGTVVPDFALPDLTGDTVTLSKVQKDTTLLIFWASWCPHCVQMLPQIKQWLKQQTLSNFEVVAISIDTSRNDLNSKVAEMGTESWCNLSDLRGWDGQTTINYNVFATPTLFLIDKNRRILARPKTVSELITDAQKPR
jgi:peroxiredoxin